MQTRFARQSLLLAAATGLLIIVVILVFQFVSNPAGRGAQSETQQIEATSDGQQGYPAADTSPTAGDPISMETEVFELTASAPAPVASATRPIVVGDGVVEDISGNYRLELLPGWWARMKVDAILTNYDPETHDHFVDDDVKLQIGIGRLEVGQEFDEWVMEWIAATEEGAPEPQPYNFNGFEGVTYQVQGQFVTKVDIVPIDAVRILVISTSPLSDSAALDEANQILSSFEVLPDPQQ